MRERRSHNLAPLKDLVGASKKEVKWIKVQQKASEDIKKVVAKEIILNYPKFNEVFTIYLYTSDKLLSAVIPQGRKPLAL